MSNSNIAESGTSGSSETDGLGNNSQTKRQIIMMMRPCLGTGHQDYGEENGGQW